MCQFGKRFDWKDACSQCALWSWQSYWLRAWFSLLYSNCNTNFTGSAAHLFAAGTIQQIALLPDLISCLNSFTCFLSVNFLPPCPHGFNLVQGVWKAAGMHINTAKRQGLRCWKVRPAWRHTIRSRLGSGNLQPLAGLQIASLARTTPLLGKCDTCWRDSA